MDGWGVRAIAFGPNCRRRSCLRVSSSESRIWRTTPPTRSFSSDPTPNVELPRRAFARTSSWTNRYSGVLRRRFPTTKRVAPTIPVATHAIWAPAFDIVYVAIGRNRFYFSTRRRRGVSSWTRSPFGPPSDIYEDFADMPEDPNNAPAGSDSPEDPHDSPAGSDSPPKEPSKACDPTVWPIPFREVVRL